MKHIMITTCRDCPYVGNYDPPHLMGKVYCKRHARGMAEEGGGYMVSDDDPFPDWCDLEDIIG